MAKQQQLNPKFESKCKFVIENVPVYYAMLFEDFRDNYEGKETYKITALLPDGLADKMEASGFNIKEDDEGHKFLDCKRNCKLKSGKEMPPPIIVWDDGSKFDRDEAGSIGNGTVCDLHVTAQYTKVGKVTHLPCYLDKVVIKEFVPYDGGGAAEKADDIF